MKEKIYCSHCGALNEIVWDDDVRTDGDAFYLYAIDYFKFSVYNIFNR